MGLTAVPSARAGRRFASPLSRAIARREGLDLADVSGSGPQGRIVRADVEAALRGQGVQPRSSAAPESGGPPFDAVPNGIGRKLLARRLAESKQQAPHFYVRIDCDMDAVQAARAATRAQAAVVPSINDYVIKAAALALRDVPGVNASYTDAAIRRYRDVHVAVAVALPDGLLTPVVRDADSKSLAQISAEVRAFATAARAGTLEPGASRDGTFSVSNLGAQGVREFAAVINPPQGAILAVGAAEQRPVVRNGALAVAMVMTVTLSVDHRVIDGALAGQWLAAFKRRIEDPGSLDAGAGR